MNRPDWLEWRRSGLGGSDVAAALGVSPWQSEFELWLSKVHAVDEADDAVKARGKRLEKAVLEWGAEDAGGTLGFADPATGPEPWMLGTADGLVHLPGQVDGLEGKTSRDKQWAQLPLHVELQVRHYMIVYDLDRWHVASYHTFHDAWGRIVVERNAAIEAAMVSRCRAWWERHVIDGERPPMTGKRTSRWLREQHPHGKGWRDGDADDRLLVHRYRQAKAREKEAKAVREAYGLQLQEAIGDHEGVRGDGWSAKWSRWESRRTDLKRLRKERPELIPELEDYTTSSPTGRLYLKGD